MKPDTIAIQQVRNFDILPACAMIRPAAAVLITGVSKTTLYDTLGAARAKGAVGAAGWSKSDLLQFMQDRSYQTQNPPTPA